MVMTPAASMRWWRTRQCGARASSPANPLRERLQRPHHAGTQYNDHDALLSERRIGKASAEPAGDYADICSAGTAATSGNVRNVGITQVSE